MWFLFGDVSSSSGCLGWARLFYCGTPLAFHIIILVNHMFNSILQLHYFDVCSVFVCELVFGLRTLTNTFTYLTDIC